MAVVLQSQVSAISIILAIATLGCAHISLELLIIELKDAQEQWKGRGTGTFPEVLHPLTEVKTKPYTERKKNP